jgi:hypothetical protein
MLKTPPWLWNLKEYFLECSYLLPTDAMMIEMLQIGNTIDPSMKKVLDKLE